ncbi:hypothetical protein CTI14_70395, partial [Methylobacterium radiotolerans]
GALAAMAASAGWWILAVELTPASARPFIGGSQSNSILELTFGALAAMAASAGWWILAVELTPASARPFIGGSQ